MILGMARDPQFGPVLMFGLGGVFVEALRDVSVCIHPLTNVAAQAMIERVKGYKLLSGMRGEEPVALTIGKLEGVGVVAKGRAPLEFQFGAQW